MRKVGSSRVRERGQGLAEYALILSLVALIVIALVFLFGDGVKKLYCSAVWAVAPDTDAPGCQSIDVSCVLIGTQTGRANVEAIVTDNQGDDDITKVVFSVDGGPGREENYFHYCLYPTDSAGCGYQWVGTGPHTITAIATDAENNTGQCTISVDVP